MDTLRGHLLISSPAMLDSNFRRSVLLIVEHGDDGAMGVILNRPVAARVADATPELASIAAADDPLFLGGPVQPTSVVILAEFDDPAQAALIAFDDVGVLAADAARSPGGPATRRARVFAGYAGWAPDQLEAELEREDWIVEPALAAEVFTGDPERLWSAVLARKGGHYALLARMPADPSMN